MDFLDKVSESAQKVGGELATQIGGWAKKVHKAVDMEWKEMQIRYAISHLKDEKGDKLRQIGERIYIRYLDGLYQDAGIEDLVNEVRAIEEQVVQKREQLTAMQKQREDA
ncbi:MAG: hypothetical protein HYU64_06660 [Armatimonadetes bacterium]|nr:hypothetical protein [Armatimonadota bacterium]